MIEGGARARGAPPSSALAPQPDRRSRRVSSWPASSSSARHGRSEVEALVSAIRVLAGAPRPTVIQTRGGSCREAASSKTLAVNCGRPQSMAADSARAVSARLASARSPADRFAAIRLTHASLAAATSRSGHALSLWCEPTSSWRRRFEEWSEVASGRSRVRGGGRAEGDCRIGLTHGARRDQDAHVADRRARSVHSSCSDE